MLPGALDRFKSPRLGWLLLASPDHVPLLYRSTPALVVEADQKEVVVFADELGFRGVLEVAAPPIGHGEISLDRDRLVPPLVTAGRVLVLKPGGDDCEPATDRFLEGMVGIGRVLREEIADRVRIVGLPGSNIGGKLGGDRFSGQGHDSGRV